MFDKRLLGKWRSDRRMTFLHFKPKSGSTPQNLRKLKAMFGKLVIQWDRSKYHVELDGNCDSTPYEIVASDADSVVIRHRDRLTGQECLLQIHFEGDRYWFAVRRFIEWFRKVETEH